MTVRNFNETDFQAVCHIYIDAKRDELQFENSNFAITPLDQDAIILAAFKDLAVRTRHRALWRGAHIQ